MTTWDIDESGRTELQDETSERAYIEYPQGLEVESSIGTLELAVTDHNHIHVSAGPTDRKRDRPYVNFRGTEYRISAHVWIHANGEARLNPPDTNVEGKMYMSRTASGDWNKPVAPTHEKAAKKVILETVGAWAVQHPEVFARADKAATSNKLRSLEENIDELQKQLESKKAEHLAVRDRYAQRAGKSIFNYQKQDLT